MGHRQVSIAPRFSASSGWFQEASADEEAARQYLAEFETLVDEGGYDARQVFNADETGLYWKKCLKTLSIPRMK